MKPRINWERVWRGFDKWRCRNEIDGGFYPFETERSAEIQRLVNAELRKTRKARKK